MGPALLHLLIGPTASGKSALALELARRADFELVSLDSMLVYRGMDVGTAKPSAAERAEIAHHALDLVTPDRVFTLQDYLRAAQAALDEIHARGRQALFVGGTALYLKALLYGLFDGPDVDPALRAALEQRYRAEGAQALHAELARHDPRAAARIHANDRKRLVRALEVWHQTGRSLSDWQAQWGGAPARPHRIVGLAAPVDELDARNARRVEQMLDNGWREEALAIRSSCGFGATASQALGYREVLRWADGECSRAAAREAIYLATRQFARRQRTWFRKFEQVQWLPAPQTREDLAARADEVLESWF